MSLSVSFHTYPQYWPFPVSWRSGSQRSYKYECGHALRLGMQRHGVKTFRAKKNQPVNSDLAVIWSWKQPRLIEHVQRAGGHILVMERGFLPIRKQWCSLALDGYNGRGKFAPPGDSGERWQSHFGHLIKPCRPPVGDYVLLLGKGANDVSLHGADFTAWTMEQTQKLRALGHRVRYRPHPDRPTDCPPGAELSVGQTLETDISNASMVVSFNSSTDVEVVLAGVPIVVTDIGSLAYPIAAHSVSDPLIQPDRTDWCNQMAWRQWTLEELRNGDAWDHVRQLVDA